MRIAIIIDHLFTDNAGTENQVSKMLRGLSSGFDIDLISLRDTEWLRLAAPGLPCNVSVIDLKSPSRPGFWIGLLRLWRLLRTRRPDVVHTFFPVANIVGVLCARLAGVKTIVASRRDYGHWMNPRYLAATRFANRFVNWIVTNSDQVKELTVRVEGFPEERVAVIYNGVEIERFQAVPRNDALKAALRIPAHHKVLTLVGNIRPIKRHDTLIAAGRELMLSHPDVSLLFVGKDNGNQAEVMALVAQFGMESHVFFAHAEGNVNDYLALTDIGVNCSESEGLSNAVIEYMAAGVPCVVSNGGGNLDLIVDGVNGLNFAVGDHRLLASQLARFLDDAQLRARCVEAARQKVQTQMSLPAMLDQFGRFYRALGVVAPTSARTQAPQLLPMKNAIAAMTYSAVGSPPVLGPLRKRVSSRGTTVFMYHEIGADSDDADAWQVVRLGDFLQQMDFLRRHYRLLSLDQAAAEVANGQNKERPAAVITFDDGHKGLLRNLLPVIQRESIPVTIYLATGHILNQKPYWFDRVANAVQSSGPLSIDLSSMGLDRYEFGRHAGATNWVRIQALLATIKQLPAHRCEEVADEVVRQVGIRTEHTALAPLTISEVKELAAVPLVTLGAHTHGHEVLTAISHELARQSIQRSSDLLFEWTGQRVRHFAYPAGFRNVALEALVRDMGFSTAMAANVGIWTKQSSLYAIPRVSVGRYDSIDKFKVDTVLGLRSIASGLFRLARRGASQRPITGDLTFRTRAGTHLPYCETRNSQPRVRAQRFPCFAVDRGLATNVQSPPARRRLVREAQPARWSRVRQCDPPRPQQ